MYRYDPNASAIDSEVLKRQSNITKLQADMVDSLPPKIGISNQDNFTSKDSMAGGSYQYSQNRNVTNSSTRN